MAAKPKPKKMSSKQMKKTKGGAALLGSQIPGAEVPREQIPRMPRGGTSVGSNPLPPMSKP